MSFIQEDNNTHIYEIGTCAHIQISKILTVSLLFVKQKACQLSSSPATIDIPSSLTLIADMGLGKTLQSLCIMAGDHHHRVRELEVSGGTTAPPSLVVCPPTLTGHWCYEVRKFCDPEDLNPLQYAGPPNTRARLVNIHNYVLVQCVCEHVSCKSAQALGYRVRHFHSFLFYCYPARACTKGLSNLFCPSVSLSVWIDRVKRFPKPTVATWYGVE